MIRIGRLARFVRGVTIAITLAAALGATPSFAQVPPVFVIDLPDGQGCNGFDLHIEGRGGDHQVFKEFKDKNGNVVRTLQGGKGFALTFQNMSTGAQLSLQPNGSVIHTTINPDGSATVAATGTGLRVPVRWVGGAPWRKPPSLNGHALAVASSKPGTWCYRREAPAGLWELPGMLCYSTGPEQGKSRAYRGEAGDSIAHWDRKPREPNAL